MKPGDKVKITSKAPHERDVAHRASLPKSVDELRHEAHLQHRIKQGLHDGKHNKPCHEKEWQLAQVKDGKAWIVELEEDGKPTDRVKIVDVSEIVEVK